jgi:nickel-type superoxide dismutase maturation protease
MILGGRFRRFAVEGASMSPTLEPGERLLVWRTQRVRPRDVVVIADPRAGNRLTVKRVAAVGPDGLWVLGDNPAGSTDSRTYGRVPPALVTGRVVYRYTPPERAGRVMRGGPVSRLRAPRRTRQR